MFRTALAIAALVAAPAFAQSTPSPEGAEVYLIGIEDGATLSNPVTLHFGLRGWLPTSSDNVSYAGETLRLQKPQLGLDAGVVFVFR